MEGAAHDCGLDHAPIDQGSLKIFQGLIPAPRPEGYIGGVGMLGLEPGQTAHHGSRRSVSPVEQSLAIEGGPVELTQ